MKAETYKEYVSPAALIGVEDIAWTGRMVEPDTAEDCEGLRSKDLGNLAHRIMEFVGTRKLEELGSYEDPWIPPALTMSFGRYEARVVWKYLDRLKDHSMVGEMESALGYRNEYQITRPFGRYILYGRPDKLIRTEEGWKIVNFKFAESDSHGEAYEFQMKFCLYLARELFRPMVGAELFYLKDGGVRKVRLEVGEVLGFEEELRGRIVGYQNGLQVEGIYRWKRNRPWVDTESAKLHKVRYTAETHSVWRVMKFRNLRHILNRMTANYQEGM